MEQSISLTITRCKRKMKRANHEPPKNDARQKVREKFLVEWDQGHAEGWKLLEDACRTILRQRYQKIREATCFYTGAQA